MSTTAQQLLAAFDALPAAGREAVLSELLTRHPVGAGDLSDAELVGAADELFRGYDAEEAGDAAAPR